MGSSANVWVPILVAVVTGLVTVITVYLSGRANLKLEHDKFEADKHLEKLKFETNSKLERQKFESSLVLQVIATGTPEASKKNLEFWVNFGFLRDPEGKIKEMSLADTPVLPARGGARQIKTRRPVFRWKVRTGCDPDANLVTETPVRTTVEELAAKPRPSDMKDPVEIYPAYENRRAEGVERTIYEVEAVIVGHKLEMSGSYHLTLKDGTGGTMIANCIDPRFVGKGGRWARQIAEVREEVTERLRPTLSYTRGTWRARITGIGFFNQFHGQLGSAPKGIELTPVLSIEWLS